MHVGERRWERLAKAKELYEEARRGGDASATSYLGCLYEEEGQLAEAMELYEEARPFCVIVLLLLLFMPL